MSERITERSDQPVAVRNAGQAEALASLKSKLSQDERQGTRSCRRASNGVSTTSKENDLRRSTPVKDEERPFDPPRTLLDVGDDPLQDQDERQERSQAETMPEPKDDRVVVHDDEIVNLDLNEPSPDVMEYARRELGESDEVKCQTLQELRDLIYERGDFLPHRMDDDFLLRFLRARNFNVHRANRLIANYYQFKEENPDIHVGVNPIKLRHIGDDDVMTVPAYRTQCGRRMVIYRMGNWNPRKYSVEEIFKATVTVLELGVLEPRAQILGGVAIFDLQGITMAHAWTITPQVANMVIALMVTSFPMKTYAIHILHQSWVFDAMFAVFKPLLDTRMQNKIFFHGNSMESLHKHISPTHLPKKYGGTREELPYYKWISQLGSQRKILEEMQQLGYVMPDDMKEALASFAND